MSIHFIKVLLGKKKLHNHFFSSLTKQMSKYAFQDNPSKTTLRL